MGLRHQANVSKHHERLAREQRQRIEMENEGELNVDQGIVGGEDTSVENSLLIYRMILMPSVLPMPVLLSQTQLREIITRNLALRIL
jgi:hypothetical protein